MNVSDPFNLRRSPALAILFGATAQTAASITRRVLESDATSTLVRTSRQITSGDMAFSIPKNVPSFTDPQREMENRVWGSSGVTARSSAANSQGFGSGMQDKLGGYFERNKEYFEKGRQLPLYKDKPYYTMSSRRRRPLWKQKRIFALVGLLVLFVLYLFGFWGGSEAKRTPKKGTDPWSWLQTTEKKVDWLDRRERVVEAFTLSWDAYERYAWGYDEFHPVTKNGKQMTPNGMGWIIVDALDILKLTLAKGTPDLDSNAPITLSAKSFAFSKYKSSPGVPGSSSGMGAILGNSVDR